MEKTVTLWCKEPQDMKIRGRRRKSASHSCCGKADVTEGVRDASQKPKIWGQEIMPMQSVCHTEAASGC